MFTVRDLEISPRELRLGGKATVAATVANRGGHAGTFKVTLQIDGLTSSAKDVTLAGGTSDRVEFSVAATAAGSFPVKVAGLVSSTLTILRGALHPPWPLKPNGLSSPPVFLSAAHQELALPCAPNSFFVLSDGAGSAGLARAPLPR